jgi:hypothetical protein
MILRKAMMLQAVTTKWCILLVALLAVQSCSGPTGALQPLHKPASPRLIMNCNRCSAACVVQRHEPQGTASSSSSAAHASLGAWAPWRTRKDDNASQQRQQQQQQQQSPASAQAREGSGHLHPRGLVLREPLVVRLGEKLALHFVALDLARCPVALSGDQAAWVEAQGLTVEVGEGAAEGEACKRLQRFRHPVVLTCGLGGMV